MHLELVELRIKAIEMGIRELVGENSVTHFTQYAWINNERH
jgi:hypothetical protein